MRKLDDILKKFTRNIFKIQGDYQSKGLSKKLTNRRYSQNFVQAKSDIIRLFMGES